MGVLIYYSILEINIYTLVKSLEQNIHLAICFKLTLLRCTVTLTFWLKVSLCTKDSLAQFFYRAPKMQSFRILELYTLLLLSSFLYQRHQQCISKW